MHPKLTENVIMQPTSTQSKETEGEKSVTTTIYKTPNYKNKKRTSKKYVTKHSTTDLKQHEEQMKKKYGVNLSIRRDVVNKTLFRSLKRHYTELFMAKFELAKNEPTESYLKKIDTFCFSLFNDKLAALQTWGITFEEVKKFISIIVSPNHIKNSLSESADVTLYKDYYSCLYQYSHKKLAKMLMNNVCGYLFNDFITSGQLSNFISKCSTMSQHSEVYEKTAADFIKLSTKLY